MLNVRMFITDTYKIKVINPHHNLTFSPYSIHYQQYVFKIIYELHPGEATNPDPQLQSLLPKKESNIRK